jgi:hypothetical protein
MMVVLKSEVYIIIKVTHSSAPTLPIYCATSKLLLSLSQLVP